MVMKRFEIMEKLYLSKALLKMAGGGWCIPHTPPMDPPLGGSTTRCGHEARDAKTFETLCRFMRSHLNDFVLL